jgi:hypothetical protein
MRLTRSQRITSATAACAVGALALIGGTYATFTASTSAGAQAISSATSAMVFTEYTSGGSFAATYSNLAAGDNQVSYINLKNSGTNPLGAFGISQVSTGDTADLGGAGSEGLSIRVDRVNFGADLVFGGTDDTLGAVIADVKLATLLTEQPMPTGPVAADEVAHLKVTVTLDPAAVAPNKSLSTVYTVNADQVVTP